MRALLFVLFLTATAAADVAPLRDLPITCQFFEVKDATGKKCVLNEAFVIQPGGPVSGVTPGKTTATEVLALFGKRCVRETPTRITCLRNDYGQTIQMHAPMDIPAAYQLEGDVVKTIEIGNYGFRTKYGVFVGNTEEEVRRGTFGKWEVAGSEWRFPDGITFVFRTDHRVGKILISPPRR
jgi:hypothetical protein